MIYCMIARYHKGDLNGDSAAKFGVIIPDVKTLFIGVNTIMLEYENDIIEKEANSDFACYNINNLEHEPARGIIERKHILDKDGKCSRICYSVAKVVAFKLLENNQRKLFDCVLGDLEEIKRKESELGWATRLNNKIIVGYKHDEETDETRIMFANVYVIGNDGKKYPTYIDFVKTTDMCKEIESDFYIEKPTDRPKKDNYFKVWCSPTDMTSKLDHVWVKSSYPQDRFCCAGSTKELIENISVKVQDISYAVMNDCRNKGIHWPQQKYKDAVGLLYAIEGVCHQMANRYLYPNTKTCISVANGHPKGYKLSCFFYGKCGLEYKTWFTCIYMCSYNKFRGAVDRTQQDDLNAYEYDREREILYLTSVTDELFEGIEITNQKTDLDRLQSEWILKREEILISYGILINSEIKMPLDMTPEKSRALLKEIDTAILEILGELKQLIGAEKYAKLNNGSDKIESILDQDLY